MKFQNKQPRGHRVPRNRNQEGRQDDHPRKGESNHPNQRNDKPFKKRFIKRDQPASQKDRKGKPGKGPRKDKRKPENRDLDRELRDYWVTQKGGEANTGMNTIIQMQKISLVRSLTLKWTIIGSKRKRMSLQKQLDFHRLRMPFIPFTIVSSLPVLYISSHCFM